jgi:hypothetical protein
MAYGKWQMANGRWIPRVEQQYKKSRRILHRYCILNYPSGLSVGEEGCGGRGRGRANWDISTEEFIETNRRSMDPSDPLSAGPEHWEMALSRGRGPTQTIRIQTACFPHWAIGGICAGEIK